MEFPKPSAPLRQKPTESQKGLRYFKASPNRLSGRPIEGTTAKYMYVKVKHGLARTCACVYDRAVTTFRLAFLIRHAGCDTQKMSQQALIFL